MKWTQPICERCWINENAVIVGDEMIIKPPYRIVNDDAMSIDNCCKCGLVTIMGIYIRIDPRTVPHPSGEWIE